MAFCWRANDGSTLNVGLVACDFKWIRTSIAKQPIFVIFQGNPVPLSPLDPRMFKVLIGPAIEILIFLVLAMVWCDYGISWSY